MSAADAGRIVQQAIAGRAFPAATVEVGTADRVIWNEAFGQLTFDEGAAAAEPETIFDLASLTKPLATTTVAMALVREGALPLDAPIAGYFEEWRGGDRQRVTVRDLLEHASGLPARLVDAPPSSRREFEHDICTIALEYAPRTQSVYSDLGFILLGLILERVGGAPLDDLFDRSMVRLKADPTYDSGTRGVRLQPNLLTFRLAADARTRAAPTEPMPQDPRRGRRLIGEVHDNYAAALGGVAGHAGLFGSAASTGAFARILLRSIRGDADVPSPFAHELTRRFTQKSAVAGSSRALGWDTMLPTSSCGTHMSGAAFGHVGYTGTSVWIDPPRDRYFVLLSNRVCGGGTLDDMRTVRRAFHDAVADL